MPPFLMGSPFPSRAPAAAFDPASYTLDGWWRAGDYDSGTSIWTPTVSAGASGDRPIYRGQAGHFPVAGSLDGKSTAILSGTAGEFLADQGTPLSIGDYTGSGSTPAGFMICGLLRVIANVAAYSPNAYDNDLLIGDKSNFCDLRARAVPGDPTKVDLLAAMFDGADKYVAQRVNMNAWTLAYMSYVSGVLSLDVGAGPATIASGLANMANNFCIGGGFTFAPVGTAHCEFAEVMLAGHTLPANIPARADLVGYFNARYPSLALT